MDIHKKSKLIIDNKEVKDKAIKKLYNFGFLYGNINKDKNIK